LLCSVQRVVLYSVEIWISVSVIAWHGSVPFPLLPFDGAWRLAADVVNDAGDAWDFVDDPSGDAF